MSGVPIPIMTMALERNSLYGILCISANNDWLEIMVIAAPACGAAPNGGPAMPPADSRVAEGSPSVS